MEKSDYNQTKSELHTHLMGMLSADKFMQLLEDYISLIYWPFNKAENENSKYLPIEKVKDKKTAISAISIPYGKRRNPKKGLESIYRNRSELISYAIKQYSKNKEIDETTAKYIIYSDYFNRALKELVDFGVKYAEISFANEDIIEHLVVDEELKKHIKYTFLLATQRTNRITQGTIDSIKRACENKVAVGFDLMGFETPLDDAELKKTGRKSYYKKLNLILKELMNHPNSVLRIHSGENRQSRGNSEKIFRIIDEIKRDNGYGDFPPPELRIGHGVYYEKNDYYYDFLKRNHAIIEINSTSNVALSNIENMDDLPYLDYLNHGIPIVLSTDGHGVYDTSILFEDATAFYSFINESGGYDHIVDWEESYIDKKVK